ncbi:isopeptide-forming domain-containing fimbrial protein [Sharpea azabuensis]|uniref:isopeptide-forming domain-containing fimbrial protein n=1 Tax=Sharpea azabuensis TaxID=322505 RepID=UPI00240A8D2C|nr:isopeptide-forming domain-containing fimbrial protein [Sharpea azabuensis]MDD6512021.1 isopeptide-forming domain-containing fimbrial protein [Sharpea azabuensis]
MKYLHKLLSFIVALTMVFALGSMQATSVSAEETKTYNLTLTGTTTGHTYEAYQVFTGDLSTNAEGKKVLSNVEWGNGVTYTGKESAADVAKALGDGTMTIAQLIDKLTLTTVAKTVTSAKDSTVIDGLTAGYYLVKDKDGTQANTSDAYTKFIVQVVGDSEVQIKSDVPTVVKKVKDTNDSTGETSGWQDSADYDIGDDVPYQITGTLPDNIADYTTYKYIFTDTMSKGLTFNNDATIKIGDTVVTGSFEEAVTKGNDSTVVTWTCNNLKGIQGVTLNKDTKVVVTYSATLNENAVIGSAGNPNTVNLTYSNNPNKNGDGETGKTPDDKNIVFTYKTVVNKVDQDGKTPLKGAGFTLQKKYKENGKTEYIEVGKINADGEKSTFEFTGLDDGDYKLIESTTPEGYNTIAPIEFTISAEHDKESDAPTLISLSGNATNGKAEFSADKDAGSLTTDVVNKKGSTLPETGGMGTTLLYGVGGVLVALAAVYVVYTKKNEKKQ